MAELLSEHTKRAVVTSTVGALVGALLAIAGYVLPLDRRLSVLESKVEDLRVEIRDMRQPLGATRASGLP